MKAVYNISGFFGTGFGFLFLVTAQPGFLILAAPFLGLMCLARHFQKQRRYERELAKWEWEEKRESMEEFRAGKGAGVFVLLEHEQQANHTLEATHG